MTDDVFPSITSTWSLPSPPFHHRQTGEVTSCSYLLCRTPTAHTSTRRGISSMSTRSQIPENEYVLRCLFSSGPVLLRCDACSTKVWCQLPPPVALLPAVCFSQKGTCWINKVWKDPMIKCYLLTSSWATATTATNRGPGLCNYLTSSEMRKPCNYLEQENQSRVGKLCSCIANGKNPTGRNFSLST